jgi:hypothetical protein
MLNWMSVGILGLAVINGPAWALELDKIEESTLFFKPESDGRTVKPFNTELKSPQLLGILPGKTPTGSTLVVADDKSLYLFRLDGNKRVELVYPGRILDPKSGLIVLDSRAYFGKCTSEPEETYIAYQSELIEKRRNKKKVRLTEQSVFTATPTPSGFDEKLAEIRGAAKLAARERVTLQKVKAKLCLEVPRRNRPISAKDAVSLRNKPESAEVNEETED